MGNVTAVHYFNSAGEEVETPTAVDTYTVKVDVAEGGNYEAITGLAVGSFTIEKATPTFTGPTAKELTYKGEPLTLVEAGSVNPGKLLYSLDGKDYSETVPTATNAGNYTVYYKVEGLDTKNYNEISSGSVPVTIRKAEAPDITFPEVLNAITYGQKLEEAKLSFYETTTAPLTGTLLRLIPAMQAPVAMRWTSIPMHWPCKTMTGRMLVRHSGSRIARHCASAPM